MCKHLLFVYSCCRQERHWITWKWNKDIILFVLIWLPLFILCFDVLQICFSMFILVAFSPHLTVLICLLFSVHLAFCGQYWSSVWPYIKQAFSQIPMRIHKSQKQWWPNYIYSLRIWVRFSEEKSVTCWLPSLSSLTVMFATEWKEGLLLKVVQKGMRDNTLMG